MRTEGFRGALLSTLVIASLMALAISLLSVSPSSAAPEGLTPRAPIYIDGDAGFTPANGVNGGGSGTESDPYIIENWDINAENAHGIEIRNTTTYFVVRNCVVENGWGAYNGIYLYNVVNGRIENTTCENNYRGISLGYSDNNTLSNNTCENNDYGIHLTWDSDNNTLSNNTCENNSIGIRLEESDNDILDTNTCKNNDYGIFLYNSDNNPLINNTCENNDYGIYLGYSDNNTLDNNTCSGNGDYGIRLYLSDHNILTNNTCENNDYGIVLYSSYNNTLSNNTCENNGSYGIYLDYSSHNTLSNNTCKNNNYGIHLGDSDNNLIDNNLSRSNYWSGIDLFYSDNNTLSNNTCENNYNGISLDMTSKNNIIEKNTCGNNDNGIRLSYSSNYNTLTNNTCENNSIGISLDYYSDNNTLSNNTCSGNGDYGIRLWNSDNNTLSNNTCENNNYGIRLDNSDNSLIYHNNLMNNTIQARDDRTNQWDGGYPSGGNYWSDYTGEDNYLGENQDILGSDGIGDTSYYIPGDNNRDRYPLMKPWGEPEARIGTVFYPAADVYAFGDNNVYSRSQLKFDISGIPSGAGIFSAKLWLYRLAVDNWDGDVALNRVENQAWDETISASEFDAQTLTDEEDHADKFMAHGWDYLNVTTQLEVDYDAAYTYTSFRLRWTNDNGSEPSIGIDDNRFLVIESKLDELFIVFHSSEYNGNDPYLEVVYAPPHAVSVSISPTYKSGTPGEELSYTVVVANTGNLDDNYVLTFSDNAGWSPTVSPTSLAVASGILGEATLTVTLPENATPCTMDNITVTAASQTDNLVIDNAWCDAHVEVLRGVEISLSPSYQSGLLGENLEYTVTVRNLGNVDDNYDFITQDTENWGLSIDSPIMVPAFENRTTMLTVTIPYNATGCTNDNVTVIATSQADNTASDNDSCVAHVQVVRGVEVLIEPENQLGVIDENVVLTVTVKNIGNVWDNYNLTPSDDAGWALKLDNDYLEIPKNENRETILTVSIPDNENLVCTTDNITVVATAVDNAEVTDNDNATIHAVPSWTGTAVFSLVNLYTVNVEKILDLLWGSKLVVKFYTYGDGYESENVIETFSPPLHVEENESARHPVDLGVKKARLDLTTDDTSNVISTMASFTVRKIDLEVRFTEIPLEWALAATPEEKTALEIEFSVIPFYWALAPS